MHKAIKIICSVSIIQFLYGCKVSKESHYSYKVDCYITDSAKHLLTSSSLISYGDYLFEFRKLTNIKNMFHGESGTITSAIEYDTIGVYLLGDKNKLYYEFDTFAIKNKIVKAGILSEKAFGQHYPASDSTPIKEVVYSTPIDTVINNINCFYVTVVSRNKSSVDSMEVKMILIKKANLNSLYKIGGTKFKDQDYCIVGYSAYSYKNNNGFVEEVNALRPLTEKEEKICESMVIKSRTCVVDTIKRFTGNDKIP